MYDLGVISGRHYNPALSSLRAAEDLAYHAPSPGPVYL